MQSLLSRVAVLLPLSLLAASSVYAHIPYIERMDYTSSAPFTVTDSIANSKAIYAWLETGTDVDAYTFSLAASERVFVQLLVPVCPGYEELRPSFAVVGPGLEQPSEPVPFTIPTGYGAVIVHDEATDAPRPTIYEPIGGKSYYEGPVFDETLSGAGPWLVYAWDPGLVGGDYTTVLGYAEVVSSSADMRRTLVNSAIVRNDGELHVACP